jgi:hypothetical protein
MLATTKPAPAAGNATSDRVSLPAGHPDISEMMKKQAQQAPTPTSQPRSELGKLFIRAIQTTRGAAAVGPDSFVVEFKVQGRLLERVEGKLDARGGAEIGRVPLALEPQPVVRITHAGATYEATGAAIDRDNPQPTIEVPVYETTEVAPEWQVRMRHVMVERVGAALSVNEMLAIANPTDRAWIGKSTASNQRVTLELNLPSQATEIQALAGFSASATRIEGARVTTAGPIIPGTTHYQISYVIPVKDGKAEITVASPVTVQNLLMFIPDDGTTVRAEGIALSGSTDMGQGKTRFYKATDVAADQPITLSISGIPEPVKTATAWSNDAATAVKIFAGASGFFVLVFGVAFLLVKGSPRKVQRA